MGKCCKKAAKKSAGAAPAASSGGSQAAAAAGSGSSILTTPTLGEAALAAGILVLLPVLLDRIAPNAIRSIKHGFELAAKR